MSVARRSRRLRDAAGAAGATGEGSTTDAGDLCPQEGSRAVD